MSQGWIGVDLDGTLAAYETVPDHLWDALKIGKPIPKMVERVKAWLTEGREVRIMTARVAVVAEGNDHMPALRHAQQCARAIKDWCEANGMGRLPVTCQKDYQMVELWDDRAVGIIKNTGERADGRP